MVTKSGMNGSSSMSTTTNIMQSLTFSISIVSGKIAMSPRAHFHVGGDVAVYVFDVNQPSLPTPFYSVHVSISVFIALSTVFRSINSPDNSLLSQSVLPVLFLPFNWSFQLYYLFMKVSFSLDIILCG